MTDMVKKDSRTCTRVAAVILLIHFQGTSFVVVVLAVDCVNNESA